MSYGSGHPDEPPARGPGITREPGPGPDPGPVVGPGTTQEPAPAAETGTTQEPAPAAETGTTQEPAPAADLDRRVLAAGTHLRFALLVVMIVSASVNLISAGVPQRADAKWLWTVAGTVITLGVAALLYALAPAWTRRRAGLVEIRDAELRSELTRLAERAGVTPPPAFRLAPSAVTASASAFGHRRSRTVSLNAGLLARRADDPEGFRFVVLHELAHLRNRDVGVAYATEALWRAVAVLVLLPCTMLALYPRPWAHSPAEVLDLWRTHWSLALRGLFRVACVATLILLARGDVMRTRELYADIDAARWNEAARRLPTPGAGRPGGGLRGWRGWRVRLRDLWRTHPAWSERAVSLLDPGPMFGVRASTMFLSGVVTAQVAVGLDVAVHELAGSGTSWASDLPEWTAAALVTGIAGVAVWRAVAYAVACGLRVPSGLRAGLWLGLGLGLGELLTFQHAGTGWLPPAPEVLLVLVAGSAVLLWWAAQCAELWVTTCRGRSLVPSHLIGTAALLVVYGGWFTWWASRGHLFVGGDFLAGVDWDGLLGRMYPGTPPEQMPYLTVLKWLAYVPPATSSPMVHVGGTVLWLFPLAVWARPQGSGPAPWLRRARPRGPWPGLDGTVPAMRWLLTRAAVGGALTVLVLLGTRMWLHHTRPPAGYRGAAWITQVSALSLLAVLTTVAVTTGAVYATTRRHRLALALTVGGSVLMTGLAAAFVLASADGCVPGAQAVVSTCAWESRAGRLMVHLHLGPHGLGLGFYAVTVTALLMAAVSRRPVRIRWGRLERSYGRRASVPGERARPARRRLPAAVAYAGGAVVAVVVCRALLSGVRPSKAEALRGGWLPEVMLWTAVALVTAAAVTAVVVALRARGGWWPARAVGAAALSLTAGTLTATALTAVEGCVPGLTTLWAGCEPRPGPVWDLTRLMLLPRLAALAVAAAALTVPVVLALRALPPLPSPVRRRRLALRRAYVVAACLAPVLLLSGQRELEAFADPSTAQGRQGAQAREKARQRERLRDWLARGGQTAMNAYATDYRALRDALAGHPPARGYPQEVYGPVCAFWSVDGAQAARLPAPPVDVPEAADWAAIAELAQRGGGICRSGLAAGSDPVTERGLSELATAADRYMALSLALYDVLHPGGKAKEGAGS
ncbi:M56 family metallopeptidase [Streptomyces sp. NPDC052676]|uniref:M56 family metallopeptidase n=1 Tax=Streptomyces sp. NPDC052676 TaxID=3154953 RepID=UPI00341A0568